VKHYHLSILPANLLSWLHVLPHFPASNETVVVQLFFGLPVWQAEDSNPVLIFELIHSLASEYDRSIAIFSF
jgi:hypothetical protein